ncbi:hypothetical protein HK103_001781 [Boothiomyces macroporosus]|uniref:Clathrin light chain n=1 Tax=Boothiomyces macroporosus TaxID=261099 RepID=A0AAD5UAI2_9FUNG|nr:hypothetical protein HK103_001781 [Boothiomyces macroporosus]
MADFGDFTNADSDPTADFLAREQAILGADAALFGNPLETSPANKQWETPTDDLLFGDTPAQQPVFEPAPSLVQTAQAPVDFGTVQQPVDFTAQNDFQQDAVQQSVFQSIPEPVQEVQSQARLDWQVEFDRKVVERDEMAKDKHGRILNEAKEALDRFYAEYNEKKQKAIARNKELEKNLIAQRDDNTSGTVWERVLKQVEGSQKKQDKKDDKKKEKVVKADTSRFKQVLVSLKNDKDAPGIKV